MLSACQNKLSGLLHYEQNGPVMDAVARFDSPQYSWLSSVVTSWLQSDLQPISCQCIDKTACTLWSDDTMFLSQYNGCLKISRIVPCRLVQNVVCQAGTYLTKKHGKHWNEGEGVGRRLGQIPLYSPHNANKDNIDYRSDIRAVTSPAPKIRKL